MKLTVTDKAGVDHDLDDILVEFATLLGSSLVRLQRIEKELNIEIETANPEDNAEIESSDQEVSE